MTARSSSPTVAPAGDPAHDADPAARSTLTLILRSLRPEQWTKNLFVFAGLLFGNQLTNANAVLLSVATFAIFCGLSGAVYIFNDVSDRSADQGPEWRGRANRPRVHSGAKR